MPKFVIDFMSSSTMTIEAEDIENEDKAREFFERQRQYLAWAELKANGIDVTKITKITDISEDHVPYPTECEHLKKGERPLKHRGGQNECPVDCSIEHGETECPIECCIEHSHEA